MLLASSLALSRIIYDGSAINLLDISSLKPLLCANLTNSIASISPLFSPQKAVHLTHFNEK